MSARLICNQRGGFSSNPGCSNCGRADYRKVGHDCEACLLWVQLPQATPTRRMLHADAKTRRTGGGIDMKHPSIEHARKDEE